MVNYIRDMNANGGGFVSKSRFKDCFATALRKPALLAKTEKNDEITQIYVPRTDLY